MAEAQVGLSESCVAGLYARDAGSSILVQHVPREDFLGQSHRTLSGCDRRQKDLRLHARYTEGKQSAVLDDLSSNLILASSELAQRNIFPAANLIDQCKVRGSQHSQILTVLLVDPLDVFRDHDANAGTHFRIRRLLAARPFASPLSTHRTYKSATLYVTAPNRRHAAALQPEVRNLAERFVKIEAVVRRRDLVGRDVVAQLGIIRWIFRVPRQILTRELPLDQFGIFGEEQDASLQVHFFWPFFNLAVEKRVDHVEPVEN